ncbi:MAG: hypothetical protein HGA45_19685 [Chloroflexales bacterium]|nr:hypothetical protein [Chloroflexales bacterium]
MGKGLRARVPIGIAVPGALAAGGDEQGWPDDPYAHPGRQQLAQLREAAEILGVREVRLLRYPDDGRLAGTPAGAAIARIARAIRRIRPQVVVTFGPDGATGHPDHIAIGQLTTGALVSAADPTYPGADGNAPQPGPTASVPPNPTARPNPTAALAPNGREVIYLGLLRECCGSL